MNGDAVCRFVYKKIMQGSCPTRSMPSLEDSSHQGQTLVIQLLFAIFLLDMTVTYPWALHNIGSSKTISGYAASSGERSKSTKYLYAAIDQGDLFQLLLC